MKTTMTAALFLLLLIVTGIDGGGDCTNDNDCPPECICNIIGKCVLRSAGRDRPQEGSDAEGNMY